MSESKSYKDYWCYKEVSKNYKTEVSDDRVAILFDDNDIYAEFKLVASDDMYFIYLDDEMINDEIDFYDTYDEAVMSCFYYFHTRF